MSNAEYKCGLCKKKYAKTPERDMKNRTRKGCFGISPTSLLSYRPQHDMMGYHKINYFKCVSYFYNSACAEWINYNSRYEKGLLPFEGSEMDQPAKFVELMDLVDNLKAEHRIITEEKAKKFQNRGK